MCKSCFFNPSARRVGYESQQARSVNKSMEKYCETLDDRETDRMVEGGGVIREQYT